MSADAKVWSDDDSGFNWKAVHDPDCDVRHDRGGPLGDVLGEVELCLLPRGKFMRWEIRVYPDGKTGLVGWAG